MSLDATNGLIHAYGEKTLDTFVRGLKGDLPKLLSIREPNTTYMSQTSKRELPHPIRQYLEYVSNSYPNPTSIITKPDPISAVIYAHATANIFPGVNAKPMPIPTTQLKPKQNFNLIHFDFNHNPIPSNHNPISSNLLETSRHPSYKQNRCVSVDHSFRS